MAYATILVRFVYFMWCSDSCPYEWDMAVPLSLYMFCVLTGVFVVWKIVACSERDMAYATILVRFFYFFYHRDG